MRDIKFEFLYKGLPFSSKNKNFNWHKKAYTLDQIMQKGLSHLADCHNYCELVAAREFTGTKDKKDIDIYEGDIIRVECCDADDYITAVRFNGGALCIDVEAFDFDYTAIGWAFELQDIISFEVVGNIHQNPDLINSLIQPTLY